METTAAVVSLKAVVTVYIHEDITGHREVKKGFFLNRWKGEDLNHKFPLLSKKKNTGKYLGTLSKETANKCT